ncbi:hypothetical protein DKX38_025328 [Salix brachista]|uniref:ATP synthase mitochondrial F1 complex assembly factor 2 n=1 Tax=Salix brachista TaxID=2182728 RepID=A0A5N5JP78_9ROSI|nr:hypothetical protein DKX38_025328 [Salix brachista]
MATSLITKTLKSIKNPKLLRPLTGQFTSIAAVQSENPSSSFTNADSNNNKRSSSNDNNIDMRKGPPNCNSKGEKDSSSVTMPISSMTGSIVGKRFYKQVTTREADDGNGWTVMLDYRTLKTPSKRPLKLPTIALAKAIAAEWDYQQTDGIRPFTMPLMKLACTALDRVPLTRPKIIEHLMRKFSQDLVFCRAPEDNVLTSGVYVSSISCRYFTITEQLNGSIIVVILYGWSCLLSRKIFLLKFLKKIHPKINFNVFSELFMNHGAFYFGISSTICDPEKRQVEKLDPLIGWINSEFGFKPVVYSSLFGGKQEEGLVKAIEHHLRQTDDCQLAVIDAIASAAHSLIIAVGIVKGKLDIEEAIELIRLEEDFQVDTWGLVEGGHDIDIADLRVQISSAAVFLGLSRK